MNSLLGKIILTIIILATVLIESSCSQQNSASGAMHNQDILKKAQNIFATDECMSKGRVGIIKDGFYVVTETNKNEILLPPNNASWQGNREENQVVFIYKGSVLDGLLPDDFNVIESIMICFEKDKIVFFDFSTFEGGYYRRSKPK